MNGYKLISILGKKFPKRIAEKYHDYVGLMTGKIPSEVNKVLLCLDYDEEVHEIAKKYKPDLVLTHHPFFYGDKKWVLENYSFKKDLYEEINKEGINIFSMHTNFDECKDGMNDALSEALNLKEVYCASNYPMMRVGYLANEMDIEDFARCAKKCLKVNYGLLVNAGKRNIKKVAIIGGGGANEYPHAIEENADIYVSGDMSHHVRREMISLKFNYLDLPHEIEKIFIYQMKKILLSIEPTLDILCVDHEKEPTVL